MARDKLVIDERYGAFRIAWLLADEGELGACVGDWDYDDTMPSDRAEAECWAAYHAVRERADGRDEERVFFFETESNAKAALRVARAAIKNLEMPMPAWAKEAIANGWKVPRGWKP